MPHKYFEPIEHVRAQEARQKGITVEQLLELERKNQQSPGVVIEDKRDAYQNMRASVKNNPREAQRQKEGEAKAKENAAKAVNLLLAPTLPSTYVGLATGAMDIGTGEAKNTVAGQLWNDTRLLQDIAIPGIIGLGAKGAQTAVRNIKWNKFLNDWEKRNYLNTRIENNFTTKGYNYTSVPESPYKEVYNSSTRSIQRVPISESELPNVELWKYNTLMGKFKGTKKETFDIGTEGVRGGAIIDSPVRDYVADISGDRVYLGTRKKIRGIPDLIHVESRKINPTPMQNGQFIPRANTHGEQEAIWWNRNRPWIEPEISPNRRILKVNELDVTPVRNLTGFDSPSFVLTEDPIPMNLVKGLDYNPIWGGYEKMVFQSPPTQRSLGKTSLAFFERPQAKLTEAERLGIPKGQERFIENNKSIIMQNAEDFAKKYGYEIPKTIEEAKKMYKRHNTWFRNVEVDVFRLPETDIFSKSWTDPKLKTMPREDVAKILASKGYPDGYRTFHHDKIGQYLDKTVFASPSMEKNVVYQGNIRNMTVMLQRPFSFRDPLKWHINADYRPISSQETMPMRSIGVTQIGNAGPKTEIKLSTQHLIPVKIADASDKGTLLGDYLGSSTYKSGGKLNYLNYFK